MASYLSDECTHAYWRYINVQIRCLTLCKSVRYMVWCEDSSGEDGDSVDFVWRTSLVECHNSKSHSRGALRGFTIAPYIPFPKQTKDLGVYLVSSWTFDPKAPNVLRLDDTKMLEVTPELQISMGPR